MQRSWLIGLLALVVLLGLGVVVAAVVMQNGGRSAAPTPDRARRPPRPPSTGGPSGAPEGSGPRQRGGGLARALEESGATDEDSAKVRAFIQTRQQLLRELRESANELRTVAADEKTTDQQASEALVVFRQKRDEVNGKVEAERKALADALDLEDRPRMAAALMAVGVLDNGLPAGGMGGGRGRGAGGGESNARGAERGSGGPDRPQRPQPPSAGPSGEGS